MQADAFDIRAHYLLFLGRLPESDGMVRSRIGQPLADMHRAFVTSAEFRDEIYHPIAKRQRGLDWPRFAAPLDARLRAWIDRQYAGSPVPAASDLHAAANWYGVLASIFRDGRLLTEIDYVSAATLTEFIDGLERAAESHADIVGSFDLLSGSVATGWAWDHRNPNSPAHVEFLINDEIIHTEKASILREDVRALGFGEGLVGFKAHLPLDLDDDAEHIVSARLAGTDKTLRNSPQVAAASHIAVGCFDFLRGTFASGWVWDPLHPNEAASVEFLLNDEVIHTEKASIIREDVRSLGFCDGLVGFQADLPLNLDAGEKLAISARLAGTKKMLGNSPLTGSLPAQITSWMNRRKNVVGTKLTRLQNRLDRAIGDRLLSIVMPVYNVKEQWLEDAIESVRAQWCTRWELICVDDASPEPHIRSVLERASASDPRIRVVFKKENSGIAQTTNAGIAVARGDHIAFMDHDDLLEPNAVYHLLNTAKSGADLIYSDEILTTDAIDNLMDPQIRPAFSWDYYISHPYFVHMICVRADIVRAIGGLNEDMAISADVDFVLRAIEQCDTIAHVPAILYRWRTHPQSTGHAKQNDVTDATLGALNRHLARVWPGASAASTPLFNQFRIDFPDDHGKTLVVIPTKNRADLLRVCIDSIRRTTNPDEVIICVVDHDSDDKDTKEYLRKLRETCLVVPYSGIFNYAKINNTAVASAKKLLGWLPRYILLANNDIEAIEPNWLERMRSIARRPDVGVVGATLLYAIRTVQHSGVTLGLNGSADHAHKFSAFYNSDGSRVRGHLQSLVSTRDYSAVTAACMMMRTSVFESVGGFDERFEVGFNDTDLCLRIGETGLKIINDGESVLLHHESATRSTSKQLQHPADDELLKSRWHHLVYGGDPFYSPLFSAWGISHQVGAFSTACVRSRLRPGLATFPLAYADAPEGEIPVPKLSLLDRLLGRRKFI